MSEECQPSFSSFARHLVAGHLALQDEEGDAVVAARLGRIACADQEVGADAVGDEGLGAVDDVAVVDPAGRRGDPGYVRPGPRLGDPQRADLLAGDPRHHPPLPLLLVAEVEDRRQGDRGVGVEARRDPARAARARQLLDPHRVVQVVAALAAVGLGELQPEEAELGAAAVEVTGEFPRLLPLIDVRRHLRGDEPRHRLAQLLVLAAERRQHRPRPAVLDDGGGHPTRCKFSVTNREICPDGGTVEPWSERAGTTSG